MHFKKSFKEGKELSELANSATPQIQQNNCDILKIFYIWIFNFLNLQFGNDLLIEFDKDVDKHVVIAGLFGFCC